MQLSKAYEYARQRLTKQHIDEVDFKALCLVCSMAGIRNSEFRFHQDDDIAFDETMLQLLLENEPLQYVLGIWDFYESEFYVGKGVLIPRPETEELVEQAVRIAESMPSPVIYDLCSGSGCIGISLAKKIKNSTVYCLEKYDDALYYLRKNADGVGNVRVVQADIKEACDLPPADMIVSNPPYIRSKELSSLQREVQYEPATALDGGDDGLDFYRIIYEKWCGRLKPNGALLLEIGNEQGRAISNILADFSSVRVIKDMYQNDRIVIAFRA